MKRPALLPASLARLSASDMNLSYAARQRFMNSMNGWANREGPVTKAPSGYGLRDIVEIEPGSMREAVANYIDALQTSLVMAQAMPDIPGADAGAARLVSLIQNALVANPWHP